MDQILKTLAFALALCGLIFPAIAGGAGICPDRVALIAAQDAAGPAERRVEASVRRQLNAAETAVADASRDDARVRMRGRSAGGAETAPALQVASLDAQIIIAAAPQTPAGAYDELSRDARDARRVHAAEQRVARAAGC